MRAVVYSHDVPSPNQASSAPTPLVTVRTQVGLREDILIEYGLHPDPGAQQGYEWSEVRGTVSLPKVGKRTVTFESPGLRAAQGGLSLDVGALGGQFEMDSTTGSIPLGRGSVEAKHVLVERKRRGGATPRQLDIRNLSWTQKMTEGIPGKTLDLSSDVRFGTVQGGASRIQQGEWHLDSRGLDYQALRQAWLASEYAQLLERILARAPRFETQFKLTTADGIIEGTGDMTTESSLVALKAGAAPTHLPTGWIMTVFFSPAVLDPAKLDPIWQANILTVAGERYRLTARYRQGVVDLNGAIVPLKDFGGRLLLLFNALRL